MCLQMIRLSMIRMHQVILLTVSQTIGVQRDLHRPTEHPCGISATNAEAPTMDTVVEAVSKFLDIDAALLPELMVSEGNDFANSTEEFQVITLEKGQELFAAGDAPALYVVVRGQVDLTLPGQIPSSTAQHKSPGRSPVRSPIARSRFSFVFPKKKVVHRVSAVDSLGCLQVITRECMRYDASSSSAEGETSVVVRLSPELFDRLVTDHSNVLQTTTKHFLRHLSPLVQQLDYAISWVSAHGGELVVHEGDVCKSMLVILCGRLRDQQNREYGIGDTLGGFEVISGETHSVTVRAVRYTELACVPRSVFNICSRKRHQVGRQMWG